MRNLSSLLVVLILITDLNGQSQYNNWYFGWNAGVSFNSGTIQPVFDSGMSAGEGCSTISNSIGQLLFYTNGVTVYDATHSVMDNGSGLHGSTSSAQSSIIVPLSGDPSKYLVVTTGAAEDSQLCKYSVVDMTENMGLGSVIDKNIFLADSVQEKLVVVQHADNEHFWVIVKQRTNNIFFSFLFSNMGLLVSSITSYAGPMLQIMAGTGQMKISPDGTLLGYVSHNLNELELFNFDATSGMISGHRHISLPWGLGNYGSYGLEFSPNSQYAYVSNSSYNAQFYQLDVSLASEDEIQSSVQLIGSVSGHGCGSLQLAPNGKIYCAIYSSFQLAAIEQPNQLGISCGFVENAVDLGDRSCRLGLPNFPRLGFPIHGTGLTDSRPNEPLTVFPNPAQSIISFEIQQGEEINGCWLVDGLGKSHEFDTVTRYGRLASLSVELCAEGYYTLFVLTNRANYYSRLILIPK